MRENCIPDLGVLVKGDVCPGRQELRGIPVSPAVT